MVSDQAILLYIDRYHVGDDLFLQALARAIQARADRYPLIVCHGSGEVVERQFEARGRFPNRTDERLEVSEAADRALLERGMRESGRELSGALTDAVVPAVSLMGADRGLLRLDDADTVHVGNAGALSSLLQRQVVPVISTLALDVQRAHLTEAPSSAVLTALFRALPARAVAFFARGGRLPERERDAGQPFLSIDDPISADFVAASAVARVVVKSGAQSYLVTPSSLQQQAVGEWWVLADRDAPGTP